MKRKIIALTVLITLVFSGCSSPGSENIFKLGCFVCDVSVESGAEEIIGELCCNSPTSMSFTVRKPENLKGLTVGTENGEDFVRIGSLNAPLSQETLTGGRNIFENLFEALGAAGNEEFKIKSTGTDHLAGNYEFGSYLMHINAENKAVLKLEAGGTAYNFSSFRRQEAQNES